MLKATGILGHKGDLAALPIQSRTQFGVVAGKKLSPHFLSENILVNGQRDHI